MAYSIGIKLAIEGEREFRTAISDINAGMKTLASEMKLAESQFDKNDVSMEKLTAVNKVLNAEIEETKAKIAMISEALKYSADNFGENDKRTQNFRRQMNNATAQLNDLERGLDKNNTALSAFTQAARDAEQRDKEFTESVKNTDQNLKLLESEMKLVDSQFDKNKKSVEKAAEVQRVLTKEIDEQKNKITALEGALEHSAREFGENDTRTKG